MLFNSFEFLFIFLPITFFIYFFLNKNRLVNCATLWLVIASLIFYSYWNIKFLPIIIISMVVNYLIGTIIGKSLEHHLIKKILLIFGIAFNLLLLCYYKYFNFLIENINFVINSHFDTLKIVLPLAISFYTFTQIAYLVDTYQGKVKEYNFINYCLFITFFPQLIVGPIVHHSEMMPQFANLRKKIINHKNISIGLFLLSIGLFKKVMIADNLSPFVQAVFDNAYNLDLFSSWFGCFSFTFQLYFDFSGYCDMAMGISYLFNIILPINFNSPYKSINISDFWNRWHITLSRFLRQYIYIPLGGSKLNTCKTYRNLFITFLLCGIWHGASWTYIIFGVMHGIAVCLNKFWKNLNIIINKQISVLVTFLFVSIVFVIFRAKSMTDALAILKSMFYSNGYERLTINLFDIHFNNLFADLNILLFIICIILIFFCKNSIELSKNFVPNKLYFIITFLLFLISVMSINKVSEFLYFQF